MQHRKLLRGRRDQPRRRAIARNRDAFARLADPLQLQEIADLRQQSAQLERLGQECIRSRREGGRFVAARGVGGDRDDRDLSKIGNRRRRLVASTPSIPGITLSIRIKSGRRLRAFSSPAWPLPASATSKPSGASISPSSIRFAATSSTTRIFLRGPS